jgi:cation:H+ antiporter
MANPFIHWIEARGSYAPWLFLALFIAASFLMIWRLEVLSAKGFEGTVLGTLVMPYCTGMGNLILAFIYGYNGLDGADIATNNLVNNVTDMTLVLGLPAIFCGIKVMPSKGKAKGKSPAKKSVDAGKTHELNRLALLLTLTAILFFTGAVWAMGRKGRIDFNDGLVLIGLFLFWQCFHVFEVLKSNVRQGKSLGWTLPFDLALLAIGAYAIYVSTDWLVHWVQNSVHHGFVKDNFGMVSGWITVLPNAMLALYYTWRRQPETVYASQVGDCHVSIPLCLGVYALYHTMAMPLFFLTGIFILLGATLVHFFFVAVLGRLPWYVGVALILAYCYFLKIGLLG